MISGQANGDAGDRWTDAANYRPYLAFDRRHWAWLWLQRSPNFQRGNPRSVSELVATGQGAFGLTDGPISSLFLMGYLFMLAEEAETDSEIGYFGTQTSTLRSFGSKPSTYPHTLPVRSICLVFRIVPTGSEISSDRNGFCYATTLARFSWKSPKEHLVMVR